MTREGFSRRGRRALASARWRASGVDARDEARDQAEAGRLGGRGARCLRKRPARERGGRPGFGFRRGGGVLAGRLGRSRRCWRRLRPLSLPGGTKPLGAWRTCRARIAGDHRLGDPREPEHRPLGIGRGRARHWCRRFVPYPINGASRRGRSGLPRELREGASSSSSGGSDPAGRHRRCSSGARGDPVSCHHGCASDTGNDPAARHRIPSLPGADRRRRLGRSRPRHLSELAERIGRDERQDLLAARQPIEEAHGAPRLGPRRGGEAASRGAQAVEGEAVAAHAALPPSIWRWSSTWPIVISASCCGVHPNSRASA